MILGTIVFATAIMTGLVGDSLTVLDRHNPYIRSALQAWAGIVATLLFVGGVALGLWLSIGLGGALLLGAALAMFTLEDCVRRLLMATFRFSFVVITDIVYFFVASGVLLTAQLFGHSIQLSTVILALCVGQAVAAVAGVTMLPRNERRGTPWASPALRYVATFGGWRALQQCIRPATLMAVRLIVLTTAGTVVLGQLEQARTYMSPALLFVQGIGDFLLAKYAVERSMPLPRALRRTDIVMCALVVATLLASGTAVLLSSIISPIMTGAEPVNVSMAIAWGATSCAVAMTMPYASLAAVRGRQTLVVGFRAAESALAVVGATALMLAAAPAYSAVLAVAVCGVGGALAQRWVAATSRPISLVPAAPGIQPTERP